MNALLSRLGSKRALLAAAAALVLLSCSAPPPHRTARQQIFDYTVLWVPSSQEVFKQCSRSAPQAASRFTPTSVQIDTLLGDLRQYRSSIEANLPLALEAYLYQVVGFNGHLLYVNCCASCKYHGIPDWRAAPVVACGGGGFYWGIVYDIQTRTFDQFHRNSASP